MLLGCTLAQYVTAVYGEGNEVTKHLVVALFAACLVPVWLAAGAVQERSRRGGLSSESPAAGSPAPEAGREHPVLTPVTGTHSAPAPGRPAD
jgi:hypothetical protein